MSTNKTSRWGRRAAALLFLIFRSAQGRLTRQTVALVDARLELNRQKAA